MEPRRGTTIGRWVARILCAVLAVPFAMGLFLVVSATVRPDPHGYAVIFGFVFCVVFGAPFLALLPLVAPPERRHPWAIGSLVALLVLVGGPFLLLLVGS